MKNSRVLITGGVSGLGRELALLYARQARDVLVLDLDRRAGAELAADPEFKAASGSVRFAFCDLAAMDAENVGPELAEVLYAGEPFDLVFCNAGISNSDDFLRTTRELDERMLNVNLIGHMQLLKALLRRGRIARRGRLAFIASASVYLPFPIALAYAASKAAVSGLAHALDPYLRGEGISVSCVYPGPLKTPHAEKYYDRFNEGKGSAPERVAKRIAHRVQSRQRRIHPDLVSGLFSALSDFAPGLLSWLMYAKYKDSMYGGQNKRGAG